MEGSKVARGEALEAVADAARDFVAATSWFRQNKACRDTFERLAVALISLSAAVPESSEQ